MVGLTNLSFPSWTQGVLITDSHLPDNPIIYANAGFVKLTGYEIDIMAENENVPAETKEAETKPLVQKLKRKTELESSLLEAIEEHGTED